MEKMLDRNRLFKKYTKLQEEASLTGLRREPWLRPDLSHIVGCMFVTVSQ